MSHVDHGWRHAPKANGGTDPIPGIGGIQFDTYPQVGGFLTVETTGDMDLFTATDGANITLSTDSATPGNITLVALQEGDIEIRTKGDGQLQLIADGEGGIALTTFDSVDGWIEVTSAAGIVTESNLDTRIAAYGDIEFTLRSAATSFTVFDSSAAPILRVDEDGSVHIRTGTSLVADL